MKAHRILSLALLAAIMVTASLGATLATSSPALAQNPFLQFEVEEEEAAPQVDPDAEKKITELESQVKALNQQVEQLQRENDRLRRDLSAAKMELEKRKGEVFLGTINGREVFMGPDTGIVTR